MFVSVNNSAKDQKGNFQKLLACDAGCMDSPIQLRYLRTVKKMGLIHIFHALFVSSAERVQLPVKLTDPLTPILYITDDSKHMNELKHTIHVKEVVEGEFKQLIFVFLIVK